MIYIVTASYSFTQFSTLAKIHTTTAREPSIYKLTFSNYGFKSCLYNPCLIYRSFLYHSSKIGQKQDVNMLFLPSSSEPWKSAQNQPLMHTFQHTHSGLTAIPDPLRLSVGQTVSQFTIGQRHKVLPVLFLFSSICLSVCWVLLTFVPTFIHLALLPVPYVCPSAKPQ